MIAALLSFIYQMIASVNKYLNPPIVKAASALQLENIEPLEFYVCQPDQVNYVTSKAYGYPGLGDGLFLGVLGTTSNPSWKGANGNLAFQDILEDIFEYNYTTLAVVNGNSKPKEVFLFPSGFCKKLLFNISDYGKVVTANSLKFHAVDPKKKNNLRTEERYDATYIIGPQGKPTSNETLYNWARIQISCEVHDASILDGQVCLNYENKNSSYGECIQDALEAKMIEMYGCLPPWVPNYNRYFPYFISCQQ